MCAGKPQGATSGLGLMLGQVDFKLQKVLYDADTYFWPV